MYYPKSQIKTGLFTNGGEYAYASTKAEYVGPYWKISSGQCYTGLSPQDKPTEELINIIPLSGDQPFSEDKQSISVLGSDNFGEFENKGYIVDYASVISYDETKGNNILNPTPKRIPTYSYPQPTQDDYTLGSFTRYFAKKANQNIYIEINKDQYTSLFNKESNWDFTSYKVFTIAWTLTGPSPKEVSNINQNVVATTERQQKITGLLHYFKDYSQFYKA